MRELLAVLESFVKLAEQHENAEIEKQRICNASALEQLKTWMQFQNQQTALANDAAFRSQALFHLKNIADSLGQGNAGLTAMLGKLLDSISPDLSVAKLRLLAQMASQVLSQINTNTQAVAQIGGQFALAANWGPSSLAPQSYYYTPPPMMQPPSAYEMPATMSMRRYDYPHLQQSPNSPTGHY